MKRISLVFALILLLIHGSVPLTSAVNLPVPVPAKLQFKRPLRSIRGETRWRVTGLTNKFITKAYVSEDQFGSYQITILFDKRGATLFEKITTKNINKPLGIFLDGVLISRPLVQEAIRGGEAKIAGNFTKEEAEELASKIKP